MAGKAYLNNSLWIGAVPNLVVAFMLINQLLCYLFKSRSARMSHLQSDRHSLVASFADRLHQRNLTQ